MGFCVSRVDTRHSSGSGQEPEALVDSELRMSSEQASALLKATALETNAALLLSFDSARPRVASKVNRAMLDLQGGQAIYQPNLAYYPQICRRLAESPCPPIDWLPGDSSTKTPHQFALNTKGYHVDRPVAAHLLQWGLTNNIPLRAALAPARAPSNPNEQPSNLSRLAVLSLAVHGQTINNDDLHAAFPLYPDPRPLYEHCRKLTKFRFMEQRGSGFLLKKEYRPAFSQLLELFDRAVNFDFAFYRDGQQIADRLAASPEAMRYLIKRVEATSSRDGKRVNYSEMTEQAISYIHQQSEPVSFDTLAERLGLRDDQKRRFGFYKALAAAGLRHVGDHNDALFFSQPAVVD